jgi:hypothetical protein
LALAVPLSRFTSRVGGGSAFFVRRHYAYWLMNRAFFKYAISALAVQVLVCIPYYWVWHFGRGTTADWLQLVSDWVFYFYLPVLYLLHFVLKPFIGDGENAAIIVFFFGPGVGALLYSLALGALVYFMKHFSKRWRSSHAA